MNKYFCPLGVESKLAFISSLFLSLYITVRTQKSMYTTVPLTVHKCLTPVKF